MMPLRKRNDMTIDNEKIAYVEGILNNLRYYRRQRDYADRQIRKYQAQLEQEKITGGVHSPPIMSSDEAKYQKGTRIYKNKVEQLLGEIAANEAQRDYFQKTLDRYDAFMNRLDPAEKDLIFSKYERQMSYEEIATELFRARESIRREIRNILMKW